MRIFPFIVFILFFYINTQAQSITGHVYDAQSGLPIANANVSISQTSLGAASNNQGAFTIQQLIPGSYQLRISQIGYEVHEQQVTVHSDSITRFSIHLQPSIIQLNKAVVVTAQRYQTRQFQQPEAISVLTQQELIQRSPRSTPEALMGATGVWIQKTNHGGGSPFIRGLTGQQTLILIDGIRLNNATFRSGPNQYFNTIDPQSIAQIEVVRGSGSVQYGSDALGGVVQVLTQTPQFTGKGNFSGSGYAKWMNGGMEQSGRAELGYSNSKVAVLGGFSVRNFGDIIAGGNLGKLQPTGYDQVSGDIKAKFRMGNNLLLTGAFQRLEQTNVPIYHKVQLENFQYSDFDPQMRQLSYVRLESFYNNRWVKHVQLTGSWHQTEEGRVSRKNESVTVTSENDKVNTWGATLMVNSVPAYNWKIQSGVEYYYDHVSSQRSDIDISTNNHTQKRGLYPDGATSNSLALFSLHSINLNKFTISAGGRFNAFTLTIPENTLGTSTISPAALVGNFSALYALHPDHHLVAAVNSAFRAPNIDDMGTLGIVDFRYEVPNVDLKPEKSINFEAGIKSKTERFSGTFTVYRNNLTNIISRVRSGRDSVQGYQVYLKENVAEAYIQGIETDAEFQLTKHLAVYGNLTYTYGQSMTDNEPFRRIPPLNGRLGLYFQKKAVWSRAEWLYAAKQARLAKGDIDDNRIPDGGTPGWNILNLYAGYQYKWLSLSGELHNILNKAYRTHGSGVEGYGRSGWIAVRVHF